MPVPDDTLEQLSSRIDLTVRDARRSIEPARRADTAGQRALAALSQLTGGRSPTESGALTLEQTLGTGGMGIVHLATQAALARKVAVKTLRPEFRSQDTAMALLREAWITGALEHPNVVPVYDLGLDADGHPYIVLKRIEGARWADLINDEETVQKRFAAPDLLEWNLQILLQVANALGFAHRRGIVHCDLKPENVMIGEFGEVYVLDWGIAVSLRDDGSGRLPLASDPRGVCGTPSYMAPEMLTGVPSERTDVYLLGGILFEIMHRRPPHEGENVRQVLASALQSNPRFSDEQPAELVRICRRALAADPDARFENVQQLRLALQGFLHRRGSAQLAAEAEVRLARLRTALSTSAERRLDLYNLFGECRFGFQQALRTWRDNPAAKEGLLAATSAMIDYELQQGDPKAARLLASGLPSLPEELGARIAEAERAWDKASVERRKLEELGSKWDPNVGRRTRQFLALVAGVVWTLTPLAFPLRSSYDSYTGMIAMPALLLLFTAALGVWARESMTKTKFNRSLLFSTMFLMVAQMLLHGGSALLKMPVAMSQALDLFLWFCFSGLLAITVDRRLMVGTAAYFAGFLVACRWPAATFPTMSASNLVLTITMVKVWSSKKTA
jgi:serine/threonine-protein kinase